MFLGDLFMEYLKPFLEALKLKPKARLTGFIFCLALLLLKPLLQNYSMRWFYKHLSWIAVLFMLLFGASLISDLLYYGKSKYVTYKSHKRFDDYVSNLSGRKLEIVKAIYESKGRSAKIRINDTDLRELVARNIIVQATESSAVFPNEENLSNPPMYFLLQPRTLDLIEKQPDFFAKRK